jgi:serine/threonine-protein kinase RsbW
MSGMTAGDTGADRFHQRFVLRRWEQAHDVHAALLGAAERQGYPAASLFAIRLALDEALSNAFRHGNRNDPDKIVTVECFVDRDAVQLDVADEGDGFDPEAVPDPTADENIEIPSGRGIVLMRSFMTEVTFEPPGNLVRMRYDRPRDAAA